MPTTRRLMKDAIARAATTACPGERLSLDLIEAIVFEMSSALPELAAARLREANEFEDAIYKAIAKTRTQTDGGQT